MSLGFVIRRLLQFVLVVWAASTLIFFLPKLAPGRDPIAERLAMMASTGAIRQEQMADLIKAYSTNFGLDKPLSEQYLTYLGNLIRLDFNYSLSMYPSKVIDLILRAMPWTIGLLATTTIISFALGTILGGLLAWPKSPKSLRYLVPPLVTLSAIPYYLLGLIFIYLFAFLWQIFPLGGGSQYGTLPELSPAYIIDIGYHSILPALSIIVAAVGFWTLAMRGMMVTTMGEDYMLLAEAKGLSGRRIFLWYAMRNAMLPQITAVALSLGTVVSGALLVEIIYRYPGMGSLLYKAVGGFDYFMMYGIVFFIIVGIGLATLAVDLLYPFLDPRIRYQRS